MPTVSIAMWRVDSATMANTTVAIRLAALQAKVTQAFSAGLYDLRIFLVPEFFFMHGNLNAEVVRWYSAAEKKAAVRGVRTISETAHNLMVVGGTVCWADSSKTPFQKRQWSIYNHAPVAFDGRDLAFYAKTRAGGEVLPTDTLRLAQARRGQLDLTWYDRDHSQPGVVYQAKVADSIHQLTGSDYLTGKTRDGNYRAPGIHEMYERYNDRIEFKTPGTRSAFAVGSTGYTAGVEICQEANFGTLRHGSPLGEVDLHLLVSNSVDPNPNEACVRDGGLYIHCDPANAPLVKHKAGGALTTVDGWQDLGNDLVRLDTTFRD